ncbi:hypothetical protein PMZ80_004338 [Knufia obscura]|uniref:Uncharacterized protein n=1 Tax=Knufia obscura TaxID=1635080 RepID=A0ABR0RRV2_9EURO|nr:hypothetical protein PMZ80_004338 [Knufia obscura]
MAQWSNFYDQDDFEPEIVVGMYDRWLSRLGFGPTQAERVLVHTPVMEVAHERRFAVSETKQSMSDFEVEHSRRMEETIAHLESHFAKHPTNESEDSKIRQSRDLIGLAPLAEGSTYLEFLPAMNHAMDEPIPPFEQALDLLSHKSVPQKEPATCELQFGMPMTVDDNEDVGDRFHEDCLETIRAVSKQSRQIFMKRPRQMKAVRIRKRITFCYLDDSDECGVKPLSKKQRIEIAATAQTVGAGYRVPGQGRSMSWDV